MHPLIRTGVPVLFVLWLLGAVLQDRLWITLVLSYLPAPAMPLLGAAWLLSAENRKRKKHCALVLVIGITALVKILAVDFAWTDQTYTGRDGYRLAHWNVVHLPFGTDPVFNALDKVDPHIVILSEYPNNEDAMAAAEAWVKKRGWKTENMKRRGLMLFMSKYNMFSFEKVEMDDGAAFKADLAGIKGRFLVFGADYNSNPFKSRAERTKQLAHAVRERQPDLPSVLAGDFNTPRDSRQLDPFRKFMRNAFEKTGHGWPYTWPIVPFPMFAIDQIWVTDTLRIHSYKLYPSWCSDHLMQVATFSLMEWKWD